MSKLMHELRGFQNNNPGNLEKGQDFNGEVDFLPSRPLETRFAQFENVDYGIRAIYRILKTYREKHGLNTIEGIINRWAPPNENDTDSYIYNVLDVVIFGIGHRTFFSRSKLYDNMYPYLVHAIIKQEKLNFNIYELKYYYTIKVLFNPQIIVL